MPFQSERQRRYMHMHHPEVAKEWERKEKSGEYTPRKKAIAKRLQKNRKRS